MKNITIPAGFVSASVGDALKKLLKGKEDVIIAMDWVDVLPKEEQVRRKLWSRDLLIATEIEEGLFVLCLCIQEK